SERADRGHHSRMCFEPSLPAVGHGSLPPRLMRRRVLLVGREGYPDKSARSPLVGRPALPRDLLGDAAGELLPPRQVRDHVADPPPWAFAEDGPVEVAIIERSQPLVEVMPFTLERTDRGPLVRRRNVDRWVAHVARSGPQRAQRSSVPGAGDISERSRPQARIQPRCRAGFPTTSSCGGRSRVTTAPAPTMAKRPISTPGSTIAPAPIDAPRRTVVCPSSQSSAVCSVPSGFVARGRRSFVKTTCGPTNTPSSSVSPSNSEALFSILQRSPITTPAPT